MTVNRAELISLARRTAALRELNTSPVWRRRPVGRLGSAPIALLYGNCQAEAVRRILLTHPGFAQQYHLLRLPAVHEISPRELGLIEALLPRVEVLITQEIKPDYRGMRLGTEQLIDRLPAGARVVRYPVAYFEGMFPFHVYVNREGEATGTSAPITDYHDLRLLHAAGQGWAAARTLNWLRGLQLDPQWLRDRAEASLQELRRRETHLAVRISDVVARPEHLTSGFHTINHPANELVVEEARQVLAHLGHADADRVLGSRQVYLDHLKAPREPQIVEALGGTLPADEPQTWRTSAGEFGLPEVVEAHLAFYAAEPALLAGGLRKHRSRLEELATVFG